MVENAPKSLVQDFRQAAAIFWGNLMEFKEFEKLQLSFIALKADCEIGSEIITIKIVLSAP